MTDFDFYRHEKIRDDLYVVTESYGKNSNFKIYVLIGKEKAAVIDTGEGAVSGLRRYVETYITHKKPMIALLTHTHPDHAGGATLFDQVYFHEYEEPYLQWRTNLFRRFGDLEHFADHNFDVINYCYQNFVQDTLYSDGQYKLLREGDTIDIGGIQLETILIAGHTAGTVGFYDRANNCCFVGDGIQQENYCKQKSFAVTYLENLDKFLKMMPENITLWTGHADTPYTIQLAKDVRQCVHDILYRENLEADRELPPFTKFRVRPADEKRSPRTVKKMHISGLASLSYDPMQYIE